MKYLRFWILPIIFFLSVACSYTFFLLLPIHSLRNYILMVVLLVLYTVILLPLVSYLYVNRLTKGCKGRFLYTFVISFLLNLSCLVLYSIKGGGFRPFLFLVCQFFAIVGLLEDYSEKEKKRFCLSAAAVVGLHVSTLILVRVVSASAIVKVIVAVVILVLFALASLKILYFSKETEVGASSVVMASMLTYHLTLSVAWNSAKKAIGWYHPDVTFINAVVLCFILAVYLILLYRLYAKRKWVY